jgi:cytochrome P450
MAIMKALPPGPPPRTFLTLLRFRGLGGDSLKFFDDLVKKYGNISSFTLFGQRFVVVNSPEVAKEVLLTQAEKFWKGVGLQNSKELFGEGLLTSEGETHRSQRRVMQPAFHAKRVEAYGPEVVGCTRAVCEGWARGGEQVVDLHAAMMRLTLVIAGKTLFGALLEEETEVVARSMEVLVASFSRAVVPWGKLLNRLPLPSTIRINRARRQLMGLVDRMIEARRGEMVKGGEVKADLLSAMLAATDPEAGAEKGKGVLTDQQLRDQAVTILTAGHETTANAMTFALWYLARYPAEQALLHEELERVLGGREPTVADLGQLERTRWVLAETMRLRPPAWSLGRENQEEMELGGYRIPKKTTVVVVQWTMHRDARFFPEPLEFRPERWKEPSHPRYAYLPFSTGPRNCIGESFAWLEMMLALAMFVSRFKFSLEKGGEELRLVPGITLRPAERVMVRVKRVEGRGERAGSVPPAEKMVCPFARVQ